MRIAYKIFGCKVSQYDAHALRSRLEARGHATVSDREAPDLLVVQGCAVTARAERRLGKFVRAALKRGQTVLVTGCAARREEQNLATEKGTALTAPDGPSALAVVARLTGETDGETPWDGHGIPRFFGHARAFLKVGDGCPGGCTYCIVPRLRGPLRSRPRQVLVDEARRLAAAGHGEIVLTAIHLGLYGRDLTPPDRLEPLVEALLETGAIGRLRLSSIEVGEVTPGLLALFKTYPALARHLHIPLQSGSDPVLARMGRRYGTADFLRTVDALRDTAPDLALSTDLIAGFPGETDGDQAATLALVERIGFSRLHVFPFSPRPGTAAAALDDPVPAPETAARAAALVALGKTLGRRYRIRFEGQPVEVLVERVLDPGPPAVLTGLTSHYVTVTFPGPEDLQGRLVTVRVTGENGDSLTGKPREHGCGGPTRRV